MIIYKRWTEYQYSEDNMRALYYHRELWDCEGWFLFGIIPLYVRKVLVNQIKQ